MSIGESARLVPSISFYAVTSAILGCKSFKIGNVSFPHEAIRGLDFFSAQVDAFPHIMSGRRPRVIWRNASTSAEKKSNPRIASWGKGIL